MLFSHSCHEFDVSVTGFRAVHNFYTNLSAVNGPVDLSIMFGEDRQSELR